jgi:hypothetical protein
MIIIILIILCPNNNHNYLILSFNKIKQMISDNNTNNNCNKSINSNKFNKIIYNSKIFNFKELITKGNSNRIICLNNRLKMGTY